MFHYQIQAWYKRPCMRPTDFCILLSARSRSPSRPLHNCGSWLSNTGTLGNCLRRGRPESTLGLPPARAGSITSAQPIPMPRQARALAFSGMISIARSFAHCGCCHRSTPLNDVSVGRGPCPGPAEAPANSTRGHRLGVGARDVRAHGDHAHDRGNARGHAHAHGHGDAASRGGAAREGPR
jgi:hypothetical protein